MCHLKLVLILTCRRLKALLVKKSQLFWTEATQINSNQASANGGKPKQATIGDTITAEDTLLFILMGTRTGS